MARTCPKFLEIRRWPTPGRDLRHDAPGRVAAGGDLAHRRRQAQGRRTARPARRGLHRRRLAGRQPQGRRVLRTGAGRASARAVAAGGVRVDPPGRGSGRGRRDPPQPGQGRHAGGLHRGQVVGLPRHRGAADDARRSAWPWSATRSSSSVNAGLEVFLDAEHFFDGYRNNPEFALRVLRAAHEAGAARLVLCDTNGGTLPHEVEQTVAAVRAAIPDAGLGAHFHNDTGCAVANALAAVRQGAVQVQGCMNGYGERTGNANLTSIIPNLTLKMGIETVPRDRLELLTPVSHHIAETGQPDARPAVALRRHQRLRPQGRAPHQRHLPGPRRLRAHACPTPSGNADPLRGLGAGRPVDGGHAGQGARDRPVSDDDVDRRPRAAEDPRARRLPLRGGRRLVRAPAADASSGWEQDFFALESFRVIVEKQADGEVITEATIKLQTRRRADHRHRRGQRPGQRARPGPAQGDRPGAIRRSPASTSPTTRCGSSTPTRGPAPSPGCCSTRPTRNGPGAPSASRENIIEASWQALSDSIVHGLLAAESSPPSQPSGE